MPTSRQAISKQIMVNSMVNVLKHITETRNEEKELVKEQSFPVARHYVDKVLGRLDRILEGESIGSMIESELENL